MLTDARPDFDITLKPLTMPKATSLHTFGAYLRLLRKRARLTQRDLGTATGYSEGQVCRFEQGHRPPDLSTLVGLFVPALDLEDEPRDVARLLELAAEARGDALVGTHITGTIAGISPKAYPAIPDMTSTSLIGRDDDVHAVTQHLRSHVRLVTLVGPPGVGKTRLALAVVEGCAADFADGAVFVPLAALVSTEAVALAIASACGIKSAPGQSALQAVQAGQVHKHMLMVLDNVEHLTDMPDLIGQLLIAAPNLTILVTSRVVLRLRSEWQYVVPPLALPVLIPRPSVRQLAEVPSVRLFVDRARALNAAIAFDETSALAIAALCIRLDGLPLAIELAAARTKLFAPTALLKRYMSSERDRLRWLGHGPRDGAPRHDSLGHAVQWSVDLLDDEAKRVFACLGVFASGCDFDAAQAVCQADLEPLERLVDANLVQSQPQADGEPRFVLLQTLREFALAQLRLGNGQELHEAQLRHARHYAEFAQRVFEGVRGEHQAEWLVHARAEHDNIQAALSFALAQQDGDTAVALAGGMWWFWYRQGLLSEGRAWLAKALEVPQHTRDRRWAIALNGAGSIAAEQGDHAAAMAYHAQGLALRQALGDKEGEGVVLHNMALVARNQGDYVRALDWFEASEALQPGVVGLVNIGITAYEMRDLDRAAAWLERAVIASERGADAWSRAFALSNLAEVLRAMGDYPRAEHLGQESLRLFDALGDRFYVPEPLLILGKIAIDTGDAERAQALALDAARRYVDLEEKHGIAQSLFVLVSVALQAAQAELAARRFGKAVALRATANRVLSTRERDDDERMLAALRGALGDTGSDTLIREGARMAAAELFTIPDTTASA